jgi:hypothetical protein
MMQDTGTSPLKGCKGGSMLRSCGRLNNIVFSNFQGEISTNNFNGTMTTDGCKKCTRTCETCRDWDTEWVVWRIFLAILILVPMIVWGVEHFVSHYTSMCLDRYQHMSVGAPVNVILDNECSGLLKYLSP